MLCLIISTNVLHEIFVIVCTVLLFGITSCTSVYIPRDCKSMMYVSFCEEQNLLITQNARAKENSFR